MHALVNILLCFHSTSHEEEQPGYILHEVMLLAAAQHPHHPAEEDDGDRHAQEARCHPPQVCGEDRTTVGMMKVMMTMVTKVTHCFTKLLSNYTYVNIP